jgi:hypothetical protein
MAHFAKIENNRYITEVIVVDNSMLLDENGAESEQKGIEYCKNLLGGEWIQTSYNGTFRKNFAYIGGQYDTERDAFIPPRPFPSWLLNEETCQWEAPIPYPDIDKLYRWDEDQLCWVQRGQ